MANVAKNTTAPLMPAVRYRDCNNAVDFLTNVFGFTEGAAFRDDKGNVQHAELWFGNGGIMIGPVADTAFGKVMASRTRQAASRRASFAWSTTPMPDVTGRAQQAGFEIVLPLTDQDYGGRDYSVRDPEGHVWTFGTYDPQKPAA